MALVSRTAALVVAWLVAVGLFALLLIALADWTDTLREEHCQRFADAHARIEAAQGGEGQPRSGGEGQDGCSGHVSFFAPEGTVNASQFS